MKKFTKGCLITALVLFILGCLICMVCGFLGGFRQIASGALNGVAGIPFGFHRHENGGFDFGFLSDDWEEDTFWESGDWNKADTSGTKQKLTVTEDSLSQLFLEMTDCNFKIEESSDENIWLSVNESRSRTYYQIEKDHGGRDILSVRNTKRRNIGNWQENGFKDHIILYLPKGCNPDLTNIMMGAGYMETTSLQADSILINVGAGACKAQALEAEKVGLLVGAGQIDAQKLVAREADMDVGVGQITVQDMDVRESADVTVGIGSAKLTGEITGELDAECSLGELQINLAGKEDDYGFDIDCDMGDVNIGSHHYSGLGDSRSWNTDRQNRLSIDCDMGTVTVRFDK